MSGPSPQPSPGLPGEGAYDRQLTFAAHGHILTNINVWSPDGRRIVYDIRSDRDGSVFDGDRIETVDVETGETRVLYQSSNGACCGVATYHPQLHRGIFILGPANPTTDWTYGPDRRQGVLVDELRPGFAGNLDARDLSPPFTAGALRGGSHVHVFSPDGALASFTYDDHILSQFKTPGEDHDINQRNIGVSVVGRLVGVPPTHPRNHDGSAFTVLVTRTSSSPQPGSDDYSRAYEEGWIGDDGYLRPDGTRQSHALAFLGDVRATDGKTITEVFIADLPAELTRPGEGPLAGTETRMPCPPAGVSVRRLTRTADRKYPGVCGPRHWVRSAPDGTRIAFLMCDDAGIVQIWTISPDGGELAQLTANPFDIASAFTWNPDGSAIAHVMDRSVCMTHVATGQTQRLTEPRDPDDAPLPLACVFSRDGRKIAFQRRPLHTDGKRYNQIFVVAAA